MIELLIKDGTIFQFNNPKLLLSRLNTLYQEDRGQFKPGVNGILGIRSVGGHETECAIIAEFLEAAHRETVTSSKLNNINIRI